MKLRNKKAGRTRSVVVSARVSVSLATRIDWLVRNHGDVEDRTEGVKAALQSWVEAREKEAVAQGLSPPIFA